MALPPRAWATARVASLAPSLSLRARACAARGSLSALQEAEPRDECRRRDDRPLGPWPLTQGARTLPPREDLTAMAPHNSGRRVDPDPPTQVHTPEARLLFRRIGERARACAPPLATHNPTSRRARNAELFAPGVGHVLGPASRSLSIYCGAGLRPTRLQAATAEPLKPGRHTCPRNVRAAPVLPGPRGRGAALATLAVEHAPQKSSIGVGRRGGGARAQRSPGRCGRNSGGPRNDVNTPNEVAPPPAPGDAAAHLLTARTHPTRSPMPTTCRTIHLDASS